MVLSTGQITVSNLFRQSYANLFNLVNNKTNVPDPLNTYNSTRQMVYSREPDMGIDFQGYPFLIIEPFSHEPGEFNLANTTGKMVSDSIIEIRCTDRIRRKEGSGEERTGLIYVEDLSKDVVKTLLDKTNRASLKLNGLGRIELSAESAEPVFDEKGDLVWIRRIRVSFRKRMVTS